MKNKIIKKQKKNKEINKTKIKNNYKIQIETY